MNAPERGSVTRSTADWRRTRAISRCLSWRGRCGSQTRAPQNAGGVPEISRGLSESASDTPGQRSPMARTPEGCQNHSPPIVLRPLRGREICGDVFRGCRCAQPPANGWHPFRMRLRAPTSDSAKATLQNAVTATDQQIDGLVYDLYGLTEEEIKLVEGHA